jgi:hypothetical protein
MLASAAFSASKSSETGAAKASMTRIESQIEAFVAP